MDGDTAENLLIMSIQEVWTAHWEHQERQTVDLALLDVLLEVILTPGLPDNQDRRLEPNSLISINKS